MDLRSKDAIESSKQHDIDMSNILIAEFMECTHPHNEITDATLYNVSHGTFELSELRYDVSWNWLMPVIEKIESLGYEVQIRSTDCIIFQLLDTLDYKPIIGTISSASGKMYSTYIAVVEFIKDQKDRKDGLKK